MPCIKAISYVHLISAIFADFTKKADISKRLAANAHNLNSYERYQNGY